MPLLLIFVSLLFLVAIYHYLFTKIGRSIGYLVVKMVMTIIIASGVLLVTVMVNYGDKYIINVPNESIVIYKRIPNDNALSKLLGLEPLYSTEVISK